jgi:hypothetical protein
MFDTRCPLRSQRASDTVLDSALFRRSFSVPASNRREVVMRDELGRARLDSFHDNGRIFGNVSSGSAEVCNFFMDEIELEQLIEFPQRMIATHSLVQVDTVPPKLLLPISTPHHIEVRLYSISNCYSYTDPLAASHAIYGLVAARGSPGLSSWNSTMVPDFQVE